jgi:ATP-dependent protease ClpP protease subunit
VNRPLAEPNVRIYGSIDESMLRGVLDQLDDALRRDGAIVVELTTLGGDADMARRIGLELRLAREIKKRRVQFVGKTVVYSAGVTIMANVPAVDRFLSRDARLLIHGRRVDRQVNFSGSLQANVRRAKELIAEFENGLAAEREDFELLIAGTAVDSEYLVERAAQNWYLTAREAFDLGLVAGIL